MKIEKMSKLTAKEYYNELENRNFIFQGKLSKEYMQIRKELLDSYEDVIKKYKEAYNKDLYFGIQIYKILNKYLNLENDMTIAADLDFWIYLSMMVIPDIIYDRWGNSRNRFYTHNKRIWPLSIWWYIHLSWQEDENKTINNLKNYSTDTIVQLTERSGSGFDIELTRSLMKRLNKYEGRGNLFRKVMVLNTIYVKTIEPGLFESGYDGYTKMLFDSLI